MPNRSRAPVGSPCWADLWTSNVEGSRRFYGELLGWEAGEPDPEFGGYFTFRREGVDVAGGMGDMGDELLADDTWKVYLATEDVVTTTAAAEARGAEIVVPPMPVGDLGIQSVMVDPTGARLGAWQAREFPGFTVLDEPGAPSWFELHTRHYRTAVDFYRTVFLWDPVVIGDGDDFRYTAMADLTGGENLAGILDASASLPEGDPAHWSVYWEVDDVDRAIATVRALGGTEVTGAVDTPYGRVATVADPAGAELKLRTG